MIDVVVKPDPKLVERFQELYPRVKYHPVASSKDYGGVTVTAQEFFEHLMRSGIDEFARKATILTYHDFLFEDLERRIAAEYAQHLPVRIRGTVLNIGDPITLPNGDYVKSIAEVLRDGTERDHRDYVPQTSFDGADLGIADRSKQWAVQSAEELRATAATEQQQFFFPAVVVYDHKMFPENKTALPMSREDRAKVIRGIYILDYIVPVKEVLL